MFGKQVLADEWTADPQFRVVCQSFPCRSSVHVDWRAVLAVHFSPPAIERYTKAAHEQMTLAFIRTAVNVSAVHALPTFNTMQYVC